MRYDNAQPLRKKIVALLLAGYAVLAVAVIVIGYLQFREFAIGERVRLTVTGYPGLGTTIDILIPNEMLPASLQGEE